MGSLNLAAACWHGAIFDGEIDMPIREGGGNPDTWFLLLRPFHESSVLAWPFKRCKADGIGTEWFEPSRCKPSQLHTVIDVKKFIAQPVSWRSPQANVKQFGIALTPDKLVCAAHVRAGGMLQVLARKAIKQLRRPILVDLANVLGFHDNMAPCNTLFDTLVALVIAVLECSEEEALDIVTQRLNIDESVDIVSANDLQQLDGAQELLGYSDRHKYTQQCNIIEAEADEHDNFAKEYRRMRVDLFAPAGESEGRNGGE
ncbi:hypothetical protein N9L68_05485 [bacterium]|nr:hypothetical protein [bacterium]